MNTDNDIRSLFKDYRPELSDGDVFMEALERRLDAVEELKHYNRTDTRHYWTGSVIAFLVGLAIGAFVLFVVVFRPASLTQLRLALEGVLLRFFAFWQVFLALAILFVALLVLIPLLRSRRHEALRKV